jgi:uncharacterized protein (TIGR03382 family)
MACWVGLIGRRGVGGLYLLHHHPWVVVIALAVLVVVLWLQRRR